jgi:hypothetical protein
MLARQLARVAVTALPSPRFFHKEVWRAGDFLLFEARNDERLLRRHRPPPIGSNPQMLCSPSRSPDLFVRNLESRSVTLGRHGSFCEGGCVVAAPVTSY